MSSQQPPFPPQPPQAPQGFPPQPPYPPQPSYGAYPPPPPPAAKSNALKWILIALGTVFVLSITVIGVGGYIAYRVVKRTGFDAELMKKNPGFAMARMAATLNPDSEVVSTDEGSGTIVVRDKNNGKKVTLKFDAEKKSMVVVDEDGKQASISITGNGDHGGIDIKGPDGKSVVSFGSGAGNSLPAWLPLYPGATVEGNVTANSGDGNSHTVTFKTKDSAAKVIDYYQAELKGFSANSVTKTPVGGLLIMSDTGGAHVATITAGESDGQTQGTITAVEKK